MTNILDTLSIGSDNDGVREIGRRKGTNLPDSASSLTSSKCFGIPPL